MMLVSPNFFKDCFLLNNTVTNKSNYDSYYTVKTALSCIYRCDVSCGGGGGVKKASFTVIKKDILKLVFFSLVISI